VVADPDLLYRMSRLNDLFGVIPAHTTERLSVRALDHLDLMAARTRRILGVTIAGVNAFLASREDLGCQPVDGGMTAFPGVLRRDADGLCRRLRERHDTTVVPGGFFGMPGCFRVALGCAPEALAGGLERLGRALDEASG
jgi:aspartate/methionine/tyrosine aminotransferase